MTNESVIFENELKSTGYKVHKLGAIANPLPDYIRRDFYKVCFTQGHIKVNYADRSFEAKDSYLFFTNPHIPYSIEQLSKLQGYACLFTEEFLNLSNRSECLSESPLFKLGGSPIVSLNEEQSEFISLIFEKMLINQDDTYQYKNEIIRTSLQLIIHEGLKLCKPIQFDKKANASERLTAFFLDLLERQFPIESPAQRLIVKTPTDFANRLSVHTNHLNRSVKTITGKTTSDLITNRIITEAKALIKFSDWDIAEIAYALGFEYTTHFNNYFRRETGLTPKSLRKIV